MDELGLVYGVLSQCSDICRWKDGRVTKMASHHGPNDSTRRVKYHLQITSKSLHLPSSTVLDRFNYLFFNTSTHSSRRPHTAAASNYQCFTSALSAIPAHSPAPHPLFLGVLWHPSISYKMQHSTPPYVHPDDEPISPAFSSMLPKLDEPRLVLPAAMSTGNRLVNLFLIPSLASSLSAHSRCLLASIPLPTSLSSSFLAAFHAHLF
ncbi:unnamed protein product [Cyclocybe aegerita]|uniref:Uncharacterized protein n=1 Tax=Cyclocybe aegerita TaxID=1973307 RepID=A0A8S0VYI7_CYCAE|nr:unnamed protein product [Cyclocybe aegerita]